MNKTRKILVDLDGVLNNYGIYPHEKYSENTIPKIKKGAKTFLKELNKNYTIVLFTSRNLLPVSKWVIENKLDKYIKDITNIKQPSFLYIDDRAVCFKGDYAETLNEIRDFEVHWKKK